MPVSVDYVARETGANLWRNRLMTVAAVLTVAVSLSLVGAALLLKQGAANAEVDWQRGTQVTVWMNPTDSPSELNAIKTQLAQLPYVSGCVYRNQQYDYLEAKHLLTADEWNALTPAITPSSFRCTPAHLADAQLVVDRFGTQPGVKNVSAPIQQIHTEQVTITVLQYVFLFLAVVLLLSAAVLILNTIRMAIFARRREVSVMKLVGATNWFIRLPFMSEGLVQGLIGSAVAAAAVLGLHGLLNHFGNPDHPNAVLTQIRLTGWEVFWTRCRSWSSSACSSAPPDRPCPASSADLSSVASGSPQRSGSFRFRRPLSTWLPWSPRWGSPSRCGVVVIGSPGPAFWRPRRGVLAATVLPVDLSLLPGAGHGRLLRMSAISVPEVRGHPPARVLDDLVA